MHNKELIIDELIKIWQSEETVKFLPTEGKSMYPLIKNGDRIKITFTNPDKVKQGDIVAFRRDRKIVVHRLIKKLNNGFIEKGDFHIKATKIDKNIILGKINIKIGFLNRLLCIIGYAIYRLGCISKPLLIIPFILNAGTRIYLKLHGEIC